VRHEEDLPFKVVRTNGHDEIVARTNNLLVGRAAFETARRLYPHERVDFLPPWAAAETRTAGAARSLW
jgi:hypothetical protein